MKINLNKQDLAKLIELLNVNAKERFGIGTEIKVGMPADLTVFNLEKEYTIDPNEFVSKGKATPFEGWNVFGRCVLTMVGGQIVYKEDNI